MSYQKKTGVPDGLIEVATTIRRDLAIEKFEGNEFLEEASLLPSASEALQKITHRVMQWLPTPRTTSKPKR
jgi:hypothetical protein